jgi:hypothetical protein
MTVITLMMLGMESLNNLKSNKNEILFKEYKELYNLYVSSY